MKQERPPEIIKENKKTGEIPTDETLFEGFYSLKSPTLEGVERLGKEISEYPEFKPRLTFHFPLDKERIGAIEMLKTGNLKESQVINLIENRDPVKQEVGEFLLRKTKGLSKESVARLQSILETKKWKGKDRELAEEIRVKIILETQKENAFDILLQMAQQGGGDAKMAAAWGLGELGNEKALPVLEELCEKGFPDSIKTVAQARVKLILKTQGEKALPILSKLFLEPGLRQIKLAAAEGLGFLPQKESIEILKKTDWGNITSWDEYDEFSIIKTSAKAIINIANQLAKKGDEKSISLLKELSRDENRHVSQPAAQVLARLIIKTEGKKADKVLKEIFNDYSEEVKETVRFEKNKHEWLLGTQKSLFAALAEELAGNLTGLVKISQQLKEKYGDKFIGINVFGSASKGYFKKGSDIDFGIIAQKDVMRSICKHYDYTEKPSGNPYELHKQIIIDEKDMVINDRFPDLFRGILIFSDFGGYRRLTRIQKKFLENTDENQWNKIREMYIQREIKNFHKLAERFGIAGEKLEKLKQMTILSRTPPPYEETLKIVQKNEKMLSKEKHSK